MRRFLSAFLASVGVLGAALAIGWTSPTVKRLEADKVVSQSEAGWISSAHEVGHFLSPFPAGYLLGRVGCVRCLTASSLMCAAGWALVFGFEWNLDHIVLLYASRVLFGLALGVVFTVVPLYIAEVSSAERRGALSTMFQAMLYLGHLIEYSIGPYVSYLTLTCVSLAITLCWFMTTWYVKESPVFLVQKGRNGEASRNIGWLLNTNDSELLQKEFRETTELVNGRQQRSVWDLFGRGYRTKLAIVCFAAAAQRFTGMSSVVAYASKTFPSTKGFLDSDEYTILFGAVVFVFSFVSASLIDSLGRRPLMITSAAGCGIAHTLTALYFGLDLHSASWLPFVTITSFSVLYSLGIGVIVNTLQGELFPPDLKGYASSIVTIVHAATSFVVTKSFQIVSDNAGLYVNFTIYAVLSLLSAVIGYFFLPETKRIPLKETQASDHNVDDIRHANDSE